MRKKEREAIIHKPSVHEVFYCLCDMPSWSEILLSKETNKPYKRFLLWLIESKFKTQRNEKLSVKALASDFGISSAKATQWLFSIYEDILSLNQESPELFCTTGHAVTLYMKHYDSHATFALSFPSIPREFENITFDFIKAKIGTNNFWVKSIDYRLLNDSIDIHINLNSVILNKFREYALDKAEFQGWIHWRDRFDKYDFQIDEELKQLYRK